MKLVQMLRAIQPNINYSCPICCIWNGFSDGIRIIDLFIKYLQATKIYIFAMFPDKTFNNELSYYSFYLDPSVK